MLSNLFGVNAKAHEVPHALVGASCLLFMVPACVAFAHGDELNGAALLLVSLCAFMADYQCLATAWNVVDRWVGALYAVSLSRQCFPKGPALVICNVGVIIGMLSYSQSSQTPQQWVWRHSLWHVTMCIDLTF
eukprot:CAMPEP_0194522842 /NCGR_PEP_ID=MMETSP0253-20130528/57564_1 /TAXON_ID=2966 /ORGANISM="Noctiluca scintillans" /LENGTH=132 /DNA_ID=CAMNT_0039367321 /DNA_START=60 /DNA_END=455 /DNA_ORIENTATION=-